MSPDEIAELLHKEATEFDSRLPPSRDTIRSLFTPRKFRSATLQSAYDQLPPAAVEAALQASIDPRVGHFLKQVETEEEEIAGEEDGEDLDETELIGSSVLNPPVEELDMFDPCILSNLDCGNCYNCTDLKSDRHGASSRKTWFDRWKRFYKDKMRTLCLFPADDASSLELAGVDETFSGTVAEFLDGDDVQLSSAHQQVSQPSLDVHKPASQVLTQLKRRRRRVRRKKVGDDPHDGGGDVARPYGLTATDDCFPLSVPTKLIAAFAGSHQPDLPRSPVKVTLDLTRTFGRLELRVPPETAEWFRRRELYVNQDHTLQLPVQDSNGNVSFATGKAAVCHPGDLELPDNKEAATAAFNEARHQLEVAVNEAWSKYYKFCTRSGQTGSDGGSQANSLHSENTQSTQSTTCSSFTSGSEQKQENTNRQKKTKTSDILAFEARGMGATPPPNDRRHLTNDTQNDRPTKLRKIRGKRKQLSAKRTDIEPTRTSRVIHAGSSRRQVSRESFEGLRARRRTRRRLGAPVPRLFGLQAVDLRTAPRPNIVASYEKLIEVDYVTVTSAVRSVDVAMTPMTQSCVAESHAIDT